MPHTRRIPGRRCNGRASSLVLAALLASLITTLASVGVAARASAAAPGRARVGAASGGCGGKSTGLAKPVLCATAPGAPTGVTASGAPSKTPGDAEMHVWWTAPADNGTAITGFTVTPDPPCPGCGGVTTITAHNTTVTGLTPGTSYTFGVTATNADGTGPPGVSNPVRVYTVPSAPPVLGVKVGLTGEVQITLGTPVASGGLPVTSYYVTSSPACAPCKDVWTSLTALTVKGLTFGTEYSFAATARNAAGIGPVSAYSTPALILVQDGYWLAARDGAVFGLGSGAPFGSTKTTASDPVVGVSASPDGRGYFVTTANGTVSGFGDVRSYGGLPQLHINRTDVVAIVATEDGLGYWLVGADGEVYTFGDAPFHGGLLGLPKPVHVSNIVGMVACAGDMGYFLVGSDGGVFAFGATHYYGSLPGLGVKVNDIRAILPSGTGKGYILVGADGGAFVFGTGVRYFGSLPGRHIRVSDIVGIALTPDSAGYYMAGSGGAVFGFGDAKVYPDPKALGANLPVAAIAGV